MRKFMAFVLLAAALASAITAAGGVAAFVALQTKAAFACANVGC